MNYNVLCSFTYPFWKLGVEMITVINDGIHEQLMHFIRGPHRFGRQPQKQTNRHETHRNCRRMTN